MKLSPLRVLVPALALALALGAGGCGTASRSKASTPSTTMPSVPQVDTVRVVSRQLNMTIPLPGELKPYEEVSVFPKVTGFVQWIGVDRGSRVKRGQLLAVLVAPELVAQKAEAQAKLESAENRTTEAEAKLASDQSTYQRLKVAAATPGVISDEELEVAQKTADADRARVVALRNTRAAAVATLQSVQEIEGYLRITAPFDGVVTKRNVHPGALVGPSGGPGSQNSMLRIEEVSHLRLVVAVPEVYVAGVERGAKVSFTVPSFPGRTFSGTVARLADSIDVSTRTMPVEMDVWNPTWDLHSGMFPQVRWPVRRPKPTLFVPSSAVARTMETNFVIRVQNGRVEWVNVKLGASSGGLVEIFGELYQADEVVLHASEELRPDTSVSSHLVTQDP
ncbi:MAG: efflux RND transporter periplasmic adaptor subunit [Terriglobia bacterium]